MLEHEKTKVKGRAKKAQGAFVMPELHLGQT